VYGPADSIGDATYEDAKVYLTQHIITEEA
jgi:hypothetical protein